MSYLYDVRMIFLTFSFFPSLEIIDLMIGISSFRYNYSKDDEEIYKEFMEIANELIPHILKSEDPQGVPLEPQCFSNILRFYDGICSWEEGSATPIMHIGWAKPMVSTCSKFDAKIRRQVELPELPQQKSLSSAAVSSSGNFLADDEGVDEALLNNNYYEKYKTEGNLDENPNYCDDLKLVGNPTRSDTKHKTSLLSKSSAKDQAIIGLLSEFCHSQVLNIDYLLGQSDKPFRKSADKASINDKRPRSMSAKTPSLSASSPVSSTSLHSSSTEMRIHLNLKSAKMKGLKDLLMADKLNTNAIQLHLTAQSLIKTTSNAALASSQIKSDEYSSSRPKRSRRE